MYVKAEWKQTDKDTEDFKWYTERYTHDNFTQIGFSKPLIRFSWVYGNYTVPYSDDNTRIIDVGSELDGTWLGLNRIVKNIKLITLLPPGIEFSKHNYVRWTLDSDSVKPEIIENFRGTGKTAVVYTYDAQAGNNFKYGIMNYSVDVTRYANPGDNILEYYLVWENNDWIKPTGDLYTDALDLDGDGNTKEIFMKRTSNITFLPPEEILSKKQVAIDLHGGWSLTSPPQDLGKEVYYKLSILNNTAVNLKSMNLIDVFPHM